MPQSTVALAILRRTFSDENVRIRLHRGRAMLRAALYDRVGPSVEEVYGFDGERCARITAAVLARVGA